MLDWSNAMIAPPAIDVAVMMSSLSFRVAAPLSPEDVLTQYGNALSDNGLDHDADEIRHDAEAAVRLLIRGFIGWAGRTANRNASTRMLELQGQVAARTKSASRWLDEPYESTRTSQVDGSTS